MMAEKIKVLMLGGLRCGKTSALSSMFASFVNGEINKYLTITDETKLETNYDNGIRIVQESLLFKSMELKQLLEKRTSATFIVDQNPTNCWIKHTLKLQEPGTNHEMFIEFSDVPGSFFRHGNKHEQDVKNFIKTCDVFVIAIDTPYMMEAVTPANNLCNEAINEMVNRVQEIQQFLTYINYKNDNDAKMVIFAPIKCEKWYNEGNINKVVDRVKEVYRIHIQNLISYSKMDISILPMMTVGNIEFVEHCEPFLLKRKIGIHVRCRQLSSTFLRLADGRPYKVKEGDEVYEDPGATIVGTSLIRPTSWYKLRFVDGRATFAPKNCEQLLLHIVRFVLAKFNYEAKNRPWILYCVPPILHSPFCNFDPNRLGVILRNIQSAGLINDSEVDGIVHIKRAFPM